MLPEVRTKGRSYGMPTGQLTKGHPQATASQTQPDCIYFWGPPSPADLQRYIGKLDEDARLREVYLQEMIRGSWWMREITWLLDDVGEPLRPVEIINRLTNRCRFESWKDKYDKRLELLKLIGIMVRQGRLERYNRVKVRIPAPGQDYKFQAWLKEISKPLILPKPRLL
jgi:hypothetical protein